MLVKKIHPAPVECVVRGYLVGSGWKDYQKTGACAVSRCRQVCSKPHAWTNPSLRPPPRRRRAIMILTSPLSDMVEKARTAHGRENARCDNCDLPPRPCELAENKGIIIADTKLEFGIEDNEIMLIDEVLTPDSSRFWPADGYRAGQNPG